MAACSESGLWRPRELKDEDTARKVDRLLDKKYGLMKKMFALMALLGGIRPHFKVKGRIKFLELMI